jgi:hypothetical protein
MKKLILIPILGGLLLVSSCGNDSKKVENEPEIVTIDTSEKKQYTAAATEVKFNDPKVAAVYQNYINLKTALVNSDSDVTATQASELMTALANVSVDEEVLKAAQTISEVTDIEQQRIAFVTITQSVEKLLDGAIEAGVIYKQYCPMAFDFTGGFWLSNSKEIYNPYFGDKMLRCGKVDSEIK